MKHWSDDFDFQHASAAYTLHRYWDRVPNYVLRMLAARAVSQAVDHQAASGYQTGQDLSTFLGTQALLHSLAASCWTEALIAVRHEYSREEHQRLEQTEWREQLAKIKPSKSGVN